MSFWTPEFDRFAAPARARPALWRLFAGLALLVVVYSGCLAGLFGLIALIGGEAALVHWMQRVEQAAGPTATLLLLATFGGVILGLWAALRLVHGRGLATTLGPPGLGQRGFQRAALITAAGLVLSMVLFLPRIEILPNLPFAIWASFLPLALCLIAVQTGAEEMLFRGYLQQEIATRFANPLVWMLLPSILFGLAHYDPTATGEVAWMVALAAGLFGLLAADLTRRTGHIGAAWGMHFANNCFAILGISVQGTIPGLSLYTTELAISDAAEIAPLLWQDMAMTVLLYLAVRWAVAR
ncbi:lysostaphin resistance A-like protein [Dinoroseobacter sp. S124A]|uniref:CPBP family intramembrane glutamic endopeptidase n=1 Tax=Dinoroseobacter sp. S124A TaxID=3415128 RepID=UPI003C7A7C1E